MEAVGCHPVEIVRTVFELKDPITLSTQEVMVVLLTGQLIAIRRPWKQHDANPPRFDELPNIPVHGGNAETGYQQLSKAENLPGP
jgi:hypothetical protein